MNTMRSAMHDPSLPVPPRGRRAGERGFTLAEILVAVTVMAIVFVAAFTLYDNLQKSFKRGAGSSVKGAARRLAALLNQLDLTFYLYGMSADELVILLPKEFDRFRQVAP